MENCNGSYNIAVSYIIFISSLDYGSFRPMSSEVCIFRERNVSCNGASELCLILIKLICYLTSAFKRNVNRLKKQDANSVVTKCSVVKIICFCFALCILHLFFEVITSKQKTYYFRFRSISALNWSLNC